MDQTKSPDLPFLNAHTHQFLSHHQTVIQIVNVDFKIDKIPFPTFVSEKQCLYSLGLHPWNFKKQNYTNEELKKMSMEYINKIEQHDFHIIGEIGLDKLDRDSWRQQLIFLKFFLNEYKAQKILRPIIFHCVKAYQDLFKLLNDNQIESPIILHDFNGNKQMIEQFSRLNCYFSLGAQLVNPNSKIHKNIKNIPIEKILLETDDQSDYGIKELYSFFAKKRGLEMSQLKSQIIDNFLFLISQTDLKKVEGFIS